MEKADLEANFKQITDQLASFSTTISSINDRVTAVENLSVGTGQVDPNSSVQQNQLPHVADGGRGSTDVNTAAASYDIVQHEYKKLQDKYLKTYLSPESKLHIERTGFRGEEARKLTVVQNCTKYSETILKILAASPSETLPKETVEEIAVCATAQQCYLQGVYANLVVHSNFDSQTAKLFSQLQRNTSAFPPSLLPTLQSAAAISASASQNTNQSQNRGGYRGYRGGFNNRNFNNRGRGYQGHHSRGRYPYQVDSSFPSSRPEDDSPN